MCRKNRLPRTDLQPTQSSGGAIMKPSMTGINIEQAHGGLFNVNIVYSNGERQTIKRHLDKFKAQQVAHRQLNMFPEMYEEGINLNASYGGTS